MKSLSEFLYGVEGELGDDDGAMLTSKRTIAFATPDGAQWTAESVSMDADKTLVVQVRRAYDPEKYTSRHSATGAGKWWRIGDTKIDERTDVSTVVLAGSEHEVTEETQYETMVFGGPLSRMGVRYMTRREAAVGHGRVVDFLKKGGNEPPGWQRLR